MHNAAQNYCYDTWDEDYCDWNGDNAVLTSAQLAPYLYNWDMAYEYAALYDGSFYTVLVANDTHFVFGIMWYWDVLFESRDGKTFQQLIDEHFHS